MSYENRIISQIVGTFLTYNNGEIHNYSIYNLQATSKTQMMIQNKQNSKYLKVKLVHLSPKTNKLNK